MTTAQYAAKEIATGNIVTTGTLAYIHAYIVARTILERGKWAGPALYTEETV